MSGEQARSEQRKGESGAAQAARDRVTVAKVLGISAEKWLIIASIIVQIQLWGLLFVTSTKDEADLCWLGIALCFPVVFGLPALHALIWAGSARNKKVMMLSLLTGALSLLGFIYVYFW
jgi:hypothetical protein